VGSYQPWRYPRGVKVAVLSSGGKDSSAAIWWAQCKGWDIEYLVTVIVTGGDSMMFQVPGTHIVERQAELSDIAWVRVDTTGEEHSEISDLEKELSKIKIDGIVSGALRSDYQKNRLERMCERLGIKSFTPLWHQSAESHLFGLIENGFRVMISGVSCEGMSEKWLGHTFTQESYFELLELSKKYRFNIDGEGGEYETLVTSGPHMKGEVKVAYDTHWDGVRGHLVLR